MPSLPKPVPSSVTLYLRRARAIDALRVLLRRHDPSQPLPTPLPSDPFVAFHALRSAPSPSHALLLFRSLPSPHSPHSLQALARSLSLSKLLPDLRSFLDSHPFPPLLRLRHLATANDLHSSLELFSSIRSASRPPTEAYNIIIALHASNRNDSDAVEMFSNMVEDGALPNSRTYSVIIEHLVKAGKVDVAVQVFDRLPLMRVRRTSKQYNVLAEALSEDGRFEEVERLVYEMGCDGMLPGPAMRVAIGKMREAGFVDGTEEFVEELGTDSRIEYVLESCGDDENEDEDGGSRGGNGIQLKPWLDPNALASALKDWDPAEVEALEKVKFVWTTRLVCKLLRGFKKADTAWKFFNWVSYQSEEFRHDKQTISRMITIFARNGDDELVDRLISKVKAEGILLPFSTVRLIIDFYGLSKKADAALRVFHGSTSISGPMSNTNRMLLCSSLLRTLAKCKRSKEAMSILEEMISEGVLPDNQTFSGVMQFFAAEGDLEKIHNLFEMVRKCKLEPDAYMYQVMILAYIKHGRPALALRMFEDMRNSNLVPDAKTKSLLVKSLWNEGKRREVVYVEERCGEIGAELPAALVGNVWTASSADLLWVREVYCNSFNSGTN